MPVILLYGIYGGVTTPTEAAAVAAFYALVLAAMFYRSLSLKKFYTILVESARSSAAIGLVIGGALILNYVVASENIPSRMAASLVGLEVSPIVFFLPVSEEISFGAENVNDGPSELPAGASIVDDTFANAGSGVVGANLVDDANCCLRYSNPESGKSGFMSE